MKRLYVKNLDKHSRMIGTQCTQILLTNARCVRDTGTCMTPYCPELHLRRGIITVFISLLQHLFTKLCYHSTPRLCMRLCLSTIPSTNEARIPKKITGHYSYTSSKGLSCISPSCQQNKSRQALHLRHRRHPRQTSIGHARQVPISVGIFLFFLWNLFHSFHAQMNLLSFGSTFALPVIEGFLNNYCANHTISHTRLGNRS